MADTLESLEIEVKHKASGAETEIDKITDAISRMTDALDKALPQLKAYAETIAKVGGSVKKGLSTSSGATGTPLSQNMQDAIRTANRLDVAVHKVSDSAAKMEDAFKIGDADRAWKERERTLNAEAQVEKNIQKPPLSGKAQFNIANMKEIDILREKLRLLREELKKAFDAGDESKALSIQSQILKVEKAADQATASVSKLSMAFSVVMAVASAIIKAFKFVISTIKAIGNATVKVFKFVSSIAKKVTSAFNSLAKAVTKVASSVAKLVASGISHWFEKMRDNIKSNIKPLNKLFSSLGRIAFYRLIRSAIKAVTDALKEGSDNAYFFAKNFGNATKYISDAMDSLKSAHFKMSNQLGAAWNTLLATITPVLIQIINMVTRAAEVVTQFFAIIGGRGTYLKAKDYTHAWADETEKGAKAAKEWKNQLMSFDTLNRLNEQSDSGDSDNLDPYKDYENMFEEVPIEDWLERLRDLEPYEIGLTISGALNDLTKKIDDWFLDIRPKLKKYAKDLSDLLNGLIDGTDWALLGKTIGDGLNTVFDAIDTFLTNTRWKDLGRGVGTALKSLFDTVDWDLVGSTFAHGWNALLHFIEGLVTTPGIWESMGRSIGEFVHAWFREIDINSLATSIIATINGVATAIENFLDQNPFANIAEKLTNAIQRIITEVQWGYVGEQFGRLFQEVLNQINTVIFETDWVAFGTSLGTMLNNFIANIDFNMLGQTLVGIFTSALNILYGVLITPGFAANLATSLSNFMLGALTQLADWLESLDPVLIAGAIRDFFGNIKYEEIKDAFVRVIKAAWNLAMSVKEELFPDGLLPTVTGYIRTWFNSLDWDEISDTIKTCVDEAWTLAMEALDLVEEIAKIGWEIGKRFATAIGEKFSEWWHGTILGKIFDWIKMSADPAGTAWKTIFNLAENAGTQTSNCIGIGFGSGWADDVREIVQQTGNLPGDISDDIKAKAATDLKSAGKSAIGSFEEGWNGEWSGFSSSALTLVQTLVNGISDAVNRGFSGFSTAVGTAVSDAGNKLQEFAGSARESINTVLEQGKTNLNGIVSSIQSAVNSIISQANSILSRISGRSYATGGFPEDGVFFANHNELVGQFSNGRTAVANNEQIIAGIEQGVYRAVSSALGSSNGNGEDGKELNVYIGNELVYSGYTKWNKRQMMITGGRA
jgi:phage-related protein